MADDEQERKLEGKFVAFLRWLVGIGTQAELSRKSGIPRSEINRYEQGKQKPQAATLQQMMAKIGVPQRLLGFLRWCHQLIRKAFAMTSGWEVAPASEPRLPEETRAAVWDIVERALALARAEHVLLRSTNVSHRASSPERVEALFQKLIGYPGAKQRLLIEASRAYRDPLLCLRLCRASEDAAPDDPSKALELAELALFMAQHIDLDEPASAGIRSRLEGWCTGFVGNAQRVIGSDLPGAERTFSHAWRLWDAGEDPAGLLSKAYLLDMEASLRRDQRLFPRALKLHEDALALAQPQEVGVILLNQGFTLKESGDSEGALQSLDRAAQVIDGDRQTRLRFGLRFNQASTLCALTRAGEAVLLVQEVRGLAERLGNEIDLIKTLWLEANCATGLGHREEALAKLEQVRHAFESRKLPFDYALASLDLSLLYRKEGRFSEIKVLADEMLEIFKTQQVHREAIGAVILFKEAAEMEETTIDLVRRLKDYLSKARNNPKLRFQA
ncbi:MAG TPA: helix-turn-helix transcriptional regulator [Thermoanaerobaculia bacterium]|nr:helix-turn-helix transcriptional regulator [Thermoanaerobaculia bacterium]